MDISNITQVRLLNADYKKFPYKEHYKLKCVDIKNYNQYINDLNKIIEYLHKDLKWSGIPTIQKTIERFNNNSHCLLFYYNDNPIGWNWGNKSVRFDWINEIQKLKKNELYGGGCFVTKSTTAPADAGLYNYNMIFDYWLNTLHFNVIYGYVDKWNKAALRVNYMNGLTEYNYLIINHL